MRRLFVFLLVVLFIGGCSHTNELMKYDLEGKGAYYEVLISPKTRTIQVELNVPPDKKGDNITDVLETVASVSSAILSAEKISKIKDWINTEDLTYSIVSGLKDALETYADFSETDRRKEADFIVITELEECILNVNKDNVHVSIKANAKIIDRASGNIVWENWETDTVPVGYGTGTGRKVTSGAAAKVLTALQLAALSKKEINECVGEAASEVGREMGETFREDLVESRKQ
ncbi:MAG: hypothetical protein A2V66_04175 [Ignavibacteria bacterium RBG_13_36_8]|nr:MAG: hypothetical protein A2V66_04175 [Ignavibacteria bacterium RBG_13_36_8]